MGSRVRSGRIRRAEAQIMIAPLIDIVFLLLIFFMLVTKFLSPSIAVTLPESNSSVMDDRYSITIYIDYKSDVYLENEWISLDEVTRELSFRRSDGPLDFVRLRADRSADFQSVIEVLDAIRNAGISDIAIETESGGAE